MTIVKINKNAPFTDYYDDGSIEEEGTLNRKGEKHGKAIRYFTTGEKQFEGTYVNGEIDGEWRWYFKNGNIDRIGFNKGDDWDGKFTKYYENGNIEQEIIWVGGVPEEITDYDEDGNIINV